MKGHWSHVNLWEVLCASQNLHMTSVFSFPNANEKSVLQSLNIILVTVAFYSWWIYYFHIKLLFSFNFYFSLFFRPILPSYRPHSSYSSVSHSGSGTPLHTGSGSGNPIYSQPLASPQSLSPTYGSPPSSFPPHDYDMDMIRSSPSYPEAWCSSPCPSQQSSTPSEQMYSYIPSRNSSYSSRIDYEPSSTFPRKQRGERIFIPPNVSSSTKSGSVEVGEALWFPFMQNNITFRFCVACEA